MQDQFARQRNLWRQRQLEEYVFLAAWSQQQSTWWNRLTEHITRFSEQTGRLIAGLIIIMVLITFAVVVMRYSFNFGRIAIQESVTYFHAIVITLCMAYTLHHKMHVRVDIFYNRMSARMRGLVDIVGSLLFLIPMCVTILIVSWGYVERSWRILESSPEAGGLPMVFILKTLIPMMALFLLAQATAELLRKIVYLRNTSRS